MHVWRLKDRDSLSDGFVIEISHHFEILRAELPIYYILENILWHYHIGGTCQAEFGSDCHAKSIYLGFTACPLTLPCVENH